MLPALRSSRPFAVSLFCLPARSRSPRRRHHQPQRRFRHTSGSSSPASPLVVVAAKKADRIAWGRLRRGQAQRLHGRRPPRFAPVRLTRFLKDDGIDMSAIQISDDGVTVTVVRGTAPNREGWVANASADPDGPKRADLGRAHDRRRGFPRG